MKTNSVINETENEQVFEPDFELTDELNACACICGYHTGSGSGTDKKITQTCK